MSKSADKHFNFCQIVRKNFVCSRTLRKLSVELVFYHFVNHILTNSTDLLTIKSNYRPVCDRLNTNNMKCTWPFGVGSVGARVESVGFALGP